MLLKGLAGQELTPEFVLSAEMQPPVSVHEL